MEFSKAYFTVVNKLKYAIVLLWIVCTIFGAVFGPKILQRTEMDFYPPPGSPSDIAVQAMSKDFPIIANNSQSILYFHGNDNILSPLTQDVSTKLENWFKNYPVPSVPLQYLSYFSFVEQGMEQAGLQFVSKHNKSTIMVMATNSSHLESLTIFASDLDAFVEENLQKELAAAGISVEQTGFGAMIRDAKDIAISDFEHMDIYVAPFAFIVLALVVDSFQIVFVLSLSSIVISVLTSLLILYGLSFALTMVVFGPVLMMSCLIAFSIDYSLFLMTRFKEEVNNDLSTEECVLKMIKHAGKNVFTSGITVVVCFSGLMFSPVAILTSIGIACTVGVSVCLAASLTFVPAVLLIFPNFFRPSSIGVFHKMWARIRGKVKSKDAKVYGTIQEEVNDAGDRQRKSIWSKVVVLAIKYKWVVVILGIGLTVPAILHVLPLETTMDLNQILAPNCPSSKALSHMSDDFPAGMMAPFFILIDTEKTSTVSSDPFFSAVNTLIDDLEREVTMLNRSMVECVPSLQGRQFTYQAVFHLFLTDEFSNATYHSEEGREYRWIWSNLVNQDNSSTILEIQILDDPYGDSVHEFTQQMRKVLNNQKTGYKYYLAGSSVLVIDTQDALFEQFPYIAIATLLIIIAIVGMLFRSILLPIRLVLSSSLTLSWVYALVKLVFQDGVLDWAVPEWRNSVHLVWFAAPVMSFSIVVGLGLDFDIFVTTRIQEYREVGVSNRQAILNGLYRTSWVVTCAGLIMTIAFGGLLFSPMMVIQSFALYLVAACLIDTLLVRTVIVPALTDIFGDWNWWPKKMPIAMLGDLTCDEIDRGRRGSV